MYYESIHQFFALYQARGALHLTRPKLRLHPGIIGEIYNVGVPTILMNSLGSVLVTGLNGLLMQFPRPPSRFSESITGCRPSPLCRSAD